MMRSCMRDTNLTRSWTANLWAVDLNPSTGVPSGAPHRLTQWTDFQIDHLSASADGSRLCFLRSSSFTHSDIYVGALQSRGTQFASPHRLTSEEAFNAPTGWTPDSKAVLFNSDRDGQLRIYKQDIDKDTAELISSGPVLRAFPACHRTADGSFILHIMRRADARERGS